MPSTIIGAVGENNMRNGESHQRSDEAPTRPAVTLRRCFRQDGLSGPAHVLMLEFTLQRVVGQPEG
jgi:hypothetical protein